MTNQEKYSSFCETSSRPLIFQTSKWLNLVVGEENWDAVITYNGNNVSGVFPFVKKNKFGFSQITLPPLTPYLGPIINYPSDLSPLKKGSFQRKVLQELIDLLPSVDRFITQGDFQLDYWLPFYWKGYEQTTRYTSILNTTPTVEELVESFKPTIRKAIKKASGNFSLQPSEDYESIYQLYSKDLNSKGMKIEFDLLTFKRVFSNLETGSEKYYLEAKTLDGKFVAGVFLLMDSQYVHYSFGAVTPAYRNSGVMSLLLFEGIKLAKSKKLSFNFGGSMNKTIEQFFLGFKGTRTPYMRITKLSHPILRAFKRFYHS